MTHTHTHNPKPLHHTSCALLPSSLLTLLFRAVPFLPSGPPATWPSQKWPGVTGTPPPPLLLLLRIIPATRPHPHPTAEGAKDEMTLEGVLLQSNLNLTVGTLKSSRGGYSGGDLEK